MNQFSPTGTPPSDTGAPGDILPGFNPSMLLLLGALFLASRWNYLFFHALSEVVTIAVAWSTFAIAWASRKHLQEDGRFFLGCAYCFIGFLHLLHTLAYKGMGVFPQLPGANEGTQLWIASRLFEVAALLGFALSRNCRFPARQTLPALGLACFLLVFSILVVPVFPTCYIEGAGLTAFKIVCEWIFIGGLIGTIVLLRRNALIRDPIPHTLFEHGLFFGIAAELVFCLYSGVFDLINVAGHLLKFISVLYVYRALVHFALTHPLSQLFGQLQESERTHRLAMEASSDGIIDWQVATDEASFSPSFSKLIGVEERPTHIRSWFEAVHPEDLPLLRRSLETHLKNSKERWSFEHRLRNGDGSHRWVVVSGQVVERNEEGKALRFLGALSDLTDRVAARKAQREERELFEGMFWQNQAMKLLIEPRSGRIVDANPAACEFYGYGRERLCRMRITELNVLPEDEVARKMERARSQKQQFFSFRHRLASGEVRDVEVHSGPIHRAEGDLLFSIIFDVSERKAAHRELRRLAAAIEQAGEAIVITDLDGVIIYVNPAFETITGYRSAEAVGQTHRIVKSGRQDDAFYEKLWSCIRSGEVFTCQIVNRRKDGSLYTETATISPVRDEHGQISHYVAVKRDITRELALENQLRESQKMEAIGRLAGGVAHDFNNLLQAINGNAELLILDSQPGDGSREMLEEILRAGASGARLVQQLLTFGRRRVHRLETVDLRLLLGELKELLERLLGEQVVLSIETHGESAPVRVDHSMMDQVVLNLAINGRDAMPEGGHLDLELDTVDFTGSSERPSWATKDRYCRLRVSDEGVGISPEVQAHLWEPFFSTKPEAQGTGLGLATVYSVVSQHEGRIEARPRPEGGTCFEVLLPMVATAPVAGSPAPPPKQRMNFEDLLPCKVLIADDDSSIRAIVSRHLERAGFDLLVARDGVEALDLFEGNPDSIGLLLFDVVMPRMSGKDAAAKILHRRPDLPLIFMSGYDRGTIHEGFVRDESVLFLSKPFRRADLLTVVAKALGRD